ESRRLQESFDHRRARSITAHSCIQVIAVKSLRTIQMRYASPAVALMIAAAGIASFSACSRVSGEGSAKARAAAAQNLTREPVSGSPQIKQVVDSAIEQIGQTFEYDPSYTKLEYPNGDVPFERGVCADVIVRGF